MKTQIIRIITFVVLTMASAVGAEEWSSEEIAILHKLAEQGNPGAQNWLGDAYSLGDGVVQDKRKAVYWYRKAALQGHADGQVALGTAYRDGEGVSENKREAVRWFRKAAEQGYAHGQISLGVQYEAGDGVAQDLSEATHWYREAAKQGHVLGQFFLGNAYYNGKGVDEDKDEAVRWFRKAAEWGLAEAQVRLAVAYATGASVTQDQSKAVFWYRKAAEQGHAKSQVLLAFAYKDGDGVTQDQHEAVFWYRKAAEQGEAVAQAALGYAYARGKGVTEDPREAVRWWRKAAEQGHARAQTGLGSAYFIGKGVITDYREAYIWISIAKASGNKDAADAFRRTVWRNYLSKSEINSALKEAAQRMEAIENRAEKTKETPIASAIANALAPEGIGIAEKVFENTWRSVVVVRNGDGRGSGVIIRPNIVATNCHVVNASGGNIVYKSNDRRADTGSAFFATIRRSDEDNDFCLLDVDGIGGAPMTVRRYETLKVGEDVYGLGSPKGLNLSLSDGLISQLREVAGKRLIQTNVAISPGSSGGGLFDSEGNLVGIMTSKISDENAEGLGFAIPADLVLE